MYTNCRKLSSEEKQYIVKLLDMLPVLRLLLITRVNGRREKGLNISNVK